MPGRTATSVGNMAADGTDEVQPRLHAVIGQHDYRHAAGQNVGVLVVAENPLPSAMTLDTVAVDTPLSLATW